MYFVVIEAEPSKDSEASLKYGGAHVACWANVDDGTIARRIACSLVVKSGWRVRKVVELKRISADVYSPGDDGLEYFNQALIDHEVCVFYTFPREDKKRGVSKTKTSGQKKK